MALIDQLDSLYTLDDPTDKDRALCRDIQSRLASLADEWLHADVPLSTDLRLMFARLRKFAQQTVAELDKGYDILLHYAVQRELLVNIPRAIQLHYRLRAL